MNGHREFGRAPITPNVMMSDTDPQIRQLLEELQPPETGKSSSVILDSPHAKVVLFTFAAGAGLPEHVAPKPATIQIIRGEATLTVGDETVEGKTGTWIQMDTGTPHSVSAVSPLTMLLTLRKEGDQDA